MYRICQLLALFFFATQIANAQTATLRARVVIDDVTVTSRQITPRQIIGGGPGGPVMGADERLQVDATSKGIKNFLLYVYTGRGGTKLEPVASQPAERVLTMVGGRYEPRILIAKVGDTLKVIDRGPNQHSAVLHFFINRPAAVVPQVNVPVQIALAKPEPLPVPVDCNINPSMRCYVVVLDHSYVAVSDSDGKLSIAGLPANTTVHFQIWHEAALGSFRSLRIGGEEIALKKNMFSVALVDGENDLGEITIPSVLLGP